MRSLQEKQKEAGAVVAGQAGGELSYHPFYHTPKQGPAGIFDADLRACAISASMSWGSTMH